MFGGTHCDYVDEGSTPVTTDYVSTGTNGSGGEVEEYTMGTVSSVDTATSITIYFYLQSVISSTADTVDINARINGTLQLASTVTMTGSWAWYSTTYTGSWSQSDIDSLQLQATRTVVGGGSPSSRDDDVRLAAAYATVTYTSSYSLEQSSYRWFENQDSESPAFAKTWGGTGGEYGYSTVQTSDGGYAVTGYTTSFGAGSNDMFLAKYTSTGSLSWSKTWGGTGADFGRSLVQTSDGGYAVTGYTISYGAGSNDMFLAKYTSTGSLSWSKTWGGTGADWGYSLVQTSDGGYAVTGYTISYGAGSNDMFLAKYTSTGTLSWSKTWGGTGDEYGQSLVQTSDGGYAVTGYTASYGAGSNDMFLAKYTSAGTLSWSKTWGGTGSDRGYSLVQTSDGGYAVTGYTDSYGAGGNDMFLAKYTSTGTLSWSKTWGGTSGDYGQSLVQTSDGGYAVTGYTISYGAGDYDMFLTKYTSTGTLSWSKTWGGTGTEYGRSLVQTSDGGYAVTGYTTSYGAGSSYMFLAKYDSSGNIAGCPSTMCKADTIGGGTDYTSLPEADTIGGGSDYTSTNQADTIGGGSDYTSLPEADTIGGGSDYTSTNQADTIGGGSDYTSLPEADTIGGGSDYTSITTQLVVKGTFAKAWGGISTDYGYSLVQTSDGGYAVTGQTASYGAGNDDMFLAKYTSTGALSWSKTWGGTGLDYGRSLVQTSDGGYAVTGYTAGYGAGSDDMFLAKYTSAGSLSWSKTWGGTGIDYGRSLVQTSDGGYAVTGYTISYGAGSYDMFLAKYTATGALSWSKTWGGTGTDYGYSLVQTNDGGYAVAGYTTSYGAGSNDMFLAKYTSTGTLSWSKTWGGTGSDSGYSLVQTSDGGYAVTGSTLSYGAGSNDMFLAKYTSTGSLSWSKTWGGTSSDYGQSLVQTSDGGYAVAGYTTSYGAGSNDMFLAKYTSTGSLSWSKTWGGTSSDYGYSLVQTSDGGYAVTGRTASYGAGSDDMFLAKYDSSGNIAGCASTMCKADTIGGGSDYTSLPEADTIGGGSDYTSTNQADTIGGGTDYTSLPEADTIGGGSDYTSTNQADTIGGGSDYTSTNQADTIGGGTDYTSTNTVLVAFELYIPPIDVGSPLNSVAQNTATTAPGEGIGFRLRLDAHVTTSAASSGSFKLQYAQKSGTCDTSFTGETYNDVTASSPIAYYDNPIATDAMPLATNANDPTHSTDNVIKQEYQESGNFDLVNSTAVGEDAMWDIALKDNGAPSTTSYCFRVVNSTGATISSYSVIPEITTLAVSLDQANYRWYKGQDATANNTFAQTWGGSGATAERGQDIKATLDGGYIVTGETYSFGQGVTDAYISKYDSTGTLTWNKTWGSTGTDYGYGVIETTDGGYAMVGHLSSSLAVVKYDSSGNIVWDKTWNGGGGNNVATDIIQTSDGGYAVTGYSSSSGSNDLLLIKIDSTGNVSWSKTWGSTGNDTGWALAQTADDGYAVSGYTDSYGAGSNDALLVKFDNIGNVSWSKTWGGVYADLGSALAQASNGDLIISGDTLSYGANPNVTADAFVANFSSDGNLNWSKTWGSSAGDETANDVTLSNDGGLAITGKTTGLGAGTDDLFIAKYDSAGNLEWDRTWGTSLSEYGLAIAATGDGGFVTSGVAAVTGVSNEVLLNKYDANGDIYGCVSPMCQDPSVTVYSPAATINSPTVVAATPAPTITDPSITPTTPSATVTAIAGYLTYGATSGGANVDYAHGIVSMDDGGYAMVSRTASYTGSYDVLLSRFDSVGTLIWSRTWGSTGADYPGYDLIKTADGGLVFTGYNTSLTSGGSDMHIAKFDGSGNLLWDTVWGNLGNETGYGVLEDSSGNFIVAGQSESTGGAGLADIAVVKFNSSGVFQWDRQWGGTGNEYSYSIQLTSSGNYLIGGSSALGAGSQDAVMLEYDPSGNLIWNQTWGSAANEVAYDVLQTRNGDYYVAGFTATSGNNDAAIVKYNKNREVVWEKVWGGTGTDYVNKIVETPDGNVLAVGYTASYGSGGPDAVIMKFDTNGNLLWDRTWGGTGSEAANDVIVTGDGGFVVVGLEDSFTATAESSILKYDANGDMLGCSATVCRDPAATVGSVNLDTNNPAATLNTPGRTPQFPTWSEVSRTPTTAFQTAKKVWGETVAVPAVPLAAQDTASASLRHDDPLRLRFTVGALAGAKSAGTGGVNVKLQVAPRVGTCDTSFTGESYTDLSGSTAFNYYDNTNLANGDRARVGPYDPTVGAGSLWYQNYQEASGYTNRFPIGVGDYGLWDVSLTTTDDAVYNSYCFRVINNDNSVLNTYTRVFEVSIPPAAKQQMRHGKFFDTTTETGQPFYW